MTDMDALSKRKPADLSPQLQQLLLALGVSLTEVYGAELEDIILYGSEARGEAYKGSDIDIVVVLKREVEPGTEIA